MKAWSRLTRALPVRPFGVWALRLAVLLLAVAALAPLAARSAFVSRLISERAIGAISGATGRATRLGTATAGLIPPSLIVEELAVAGPGGAFDDPFLKVGRAEAILSLGALLRGEIVVDALEVDGLALQWEAGEGPKPAGGPKPSKGAGRKISLRRLNIRDGTIAYRGGSRAFELDAAGIQATASTVPCGSPFCAAGSATAGSFSVAFEDHRLDATSVSTRFELAEEVLSLTSFRLSGAGLEAAGGATWRFRPESSARLDSRLRAEGPGLEALAGGYPLRASSLDAEVTLEIAGAKPVVSGKADLRDVVLFGNIRASTAGGTFGWKEGVFDADIRAAGVIPDLEAIRPARGGPVEATLRLVPGGESSLDLKAGPILYRDVLSRIDPLLPRSDVDAKARGEIRWGPGGASTLKGTLQVELTAARRKPATLPPGSSPDAADPPGVDLAAAGLVDLEGDGFTIRDATVTSVDTGLVAALSGHVVPGSAIADLALGISTADISRMLDALRRYPAIADLRGSVTGTVAGTLRTRIRKERITTSGILTSDTLAIGEEGRRYGPVHATAGFTQEGDTARIGSLELSGTGWSAAGDLGLDFSEDWIVRSGSMRISGLPADPIWDLADLPSLEGGRITGSIRYDLDEDAGMSGPGIFELTLNEASFEGVLIDEAELSGTERGGTFFIDHLDLTSAAGTARLSGTYAPRSKQGSFDLLTDGIFISNLAASIDPGSEGFRGLLALSGSAEVTPEIITFTGSARGTDIEVAGFPLGNIMAPEVTFNSGGSEGLFLRVQAPSFRATGAVRVPDIESRLILIELTATGLDLADLRPLLPEGLLPGLGGTADLTVTGSIPPSDPFGGEMKIVAGNLKLSASGMEFRASEDAHITLADRHVSLAPTRIVGVGTDLAIAGSYDLGTGLSGGGSVAGRFDVGLLALAIPDLDARGEGLVELNARADGEEIDYSGSLAATGIRLNYPGSPSPIDNLQVRVDVAPDGSLSIEGLEFDFAGGHVSGSGMGRLDGTSLQSCEIRLSGSGMTTEPVPDLAILFDGNATITAEGSHAMLAGRLDVIRAAYRKEFGLQPSGLRATRTAPSERKASDAPYLALDFDIVAPSDVIVRNQSASLDGSARLKVSGSLSHPELTGRIGIFEGGTFRFRDVTYRSAGGGILFDDPDSFDPLLDFSATTDVQDYAITLHVQGRYSNPRFELSSEPALSQRDIVSLLVTGETYSSGLGPESGAGLVAEENVTQYLAAPLSETLGSTVGKAFGLTSVQLQPQFVNGSADPTARLTLTKRVSPQLLFTYSDNLGTSQDEIYQFEYDLSRAWQFIGLRDRDGSVSGDLRFRMHWGGPARPGEARGFSGRVRQAGPEISRLSFEGSPLDEEKRLRKSSGVKQGRAYSRADALEGRESLRRLLSEEGYPLAKVEMRTEERERQSGEKVVDLVYTIEPGARVGLDINGVKRDRAYKKAVREAWQRGVDLEDMAAVGRSALKAALGAQAHPAAEIVSSVIQREPHVRIVYTVDPGPRVSVRSIGFTGGRSITEKALRKVMITRENRWNTRGLFRPADLDVDLQSIQAVYLRAGYLDVSVKSPQVSFTEDRSEADIVIPVDEGPKWLVGSIEIEGTTAYPAASLVDSTLIVKGSELRPSAVSVGEERLRDLLDANGFHTVRVRSRIEGPAESARVVFTIEEGPRRVVDTISIRGNDRTAERVIKREIGLREGDPLSRNAMLEIQRKLYSLGLFSTVDVRAEPLESDPSRARVLVDIVEGDPILTGLGIGYDTEEHVQGLAQIAHNNLFGTGRGLSFLVRGSSVNRRAQASFSDRRLFGVPFQGTVTALWEEQERESFDFRRIGVGVQFYRKLTQRLTALGRYDLTDTRLLDVSFNNKSSLDELEQDILEDAVRLAQVGGSLAWDSRDDILSPTRGTFATGDLGIYALPLGSSQSFTRVFLGTSHFRSTRGGIVFAMAARIGQEQPFGGTANVPISARFFSGGDNTLRGFPVDQAGPLDYTSEEPIGGEFQLLLNGEVRFPLYRALKGVIFYDVGNTFLGTSRFRTSGTEIVTDEVADPARDCTFDFVAAGAPANERTCPIAIQDGLRHTLGAGLRLDTPLGPIRLEVGRKMDRNFGSERFDLGDGFTVRKARFESLYEIFLSIGQAF